MSSHAYSIFIHFSGSRRGWELLLEFDSAGNLNFLFRAVGPPVESLRKPIELMSVFLVLTPGSEPVR